MHGARRWYFPDGYLPTGRKGHHTSHESLCVLNVNERTAHVRVWVFFSDRDPLEFEVEVPPRRDVHLRMENFGVPRGIPYGLMLESDLPVVAQLSRLDVGICRYSLMGSSGYWEE